MFFLATLVILLSMVFEDGMKHTNEITKKNSKLNAVPSKIRQCKRRILYYAIHIETFQPILCGDI